jgi:hypothetical protein
MARFKPRLKGPRGRLGCVKIKQITGVISMNSQSATFFRFAFTIAACLVFASSGWAVNLVYFSAPGSSSGLRRGLYDFDTDTQQSRLRIELPGATSLTKLAVRPSDGIVFGIDPYQTPAVLVRLDVNTGLTTIIGPLSNSVWLAIEPGTGALWSGGGGGLYKINPTNANETLVGSQPFIGPLEFLDDGTLLGYQAGTLYRLDTTTAEPTPIGTVTPALAIVADLAHVGNRLFVTGHTNNSVLSRSIWEIDMVTGNATRLGSVNLGLSGGGLFGIQPLSKLTIDVASVSIKWPSLIGTTYQVQYRSPRTADIWTDLGDPIPGTGNEISILDSDLDDSHRTYRLQMFP